MDIAIRTVNISVIGAMLQQCLYRELAPMGMYMGATGLLAGPTCCACVYYEEDVFHAYEYVQRYWRAVPSTSVFFISSQVQIYMIVCHSATSGCASGATRPQVSK